MLDKKTPFLREFFINGFGISKPTLSLYATMRAEGFYEMENPNPLFKTFKSTNRRRVYPKGSIIFMPGGNYQDDVFFIEKGLVRVFDVDSSGNNRTVAYAPKNSIFPFTWLLKEPVPEGSLYYYQAINEVHCLTVSREAVRKILNNDLNLSLTIIDALTKFYFNNIARLQNLQRSRVGERVDFIIYYIALVLGDEQKTNHYEVPMAITHQEIADLTGLNRETVARQMGKLRYKKILKRNGGNTMINISLLEIENMPKIFPFGGI